MDTTPEIDSEGLVMANPASQPTYLYSCQRLTEKSSGQIPDGGRYMLYNPECRHAAHDKSVTDRLSITLKNSSKSDTNKLSAATPRFIWVSCKKKENECSMDFVFPNPAFESTIEEKQVGKDELDGETLGPLPGPIELSLPWDVEKPIYWAALPRRASTDNKESQPSHRSERTLLIWIGDSYVTDPKNPPSDATALNMRGGRRFHHLLTTDSAMQDIKQLTNHPAQTYPHTNLRLNAILETERAEDSMVDESAGGLEVVEASPISVFDSDEDLAIEGIDLEIPVQLRPGPEWPPGTLRWLASATSVALKARWSDGNATQEAGSSTGLGSRLSRFLTFRGRNSASGRDGDHQSST